MKIITLDSYEFGRGSEEFLFIAIEHSKYSQDIESFCTKANQNLVSYSKVTNLPKAIFVGQLHYSGELINCLWLHAHIKIQRHDRCISLYEEWDRKDYLVFYKHFYIRYHWSTTA
ncbi:MAG: hypothetical protein AAF383_18020 [Cyanobacteria bacterium P01_A01_bin.83]